MKELREFVLDAAKKLNDKQYTAFVLKDLEGLDIDEIAQIMGMPQATVRWYLHRHIVVVWVKDGDWYLEVRTRCRNLQSDHTCGIYETRPLICREYGLPSEGPCEYFTQDLKYDLFFGSPAEFEVWSKAELAKREARLARRREQRKVTRGGREPVGV